VVRAESDVIALVMLWRLPYRLTLQVLTNMFLQRGIVFSHARPFSGGSRERELLLVVLDHLLALCLRQVVRVADWVYSAAARPIKLIFPSAGPTDRC
jgi:hypothetical protein